MNRHMPLSEKLKALPDAPGCYIMRDGCGLIVYVGKAASLKKRLRWYFTKALLRSADPKLRSMVNSVRDLEWIVARTEAEAALTEGRLIKQYRPRYNVKFRDDKRFLMLRIDTSKPFPAFRLCRIARRDGALYFGPYASSGAARVTLDFVEKRFGLRRCSPTVPDRAAYRHCVNDVIRYCSAPCIGQVTRAEYKARLHEAIQFLQGRRPQYMAALRAEMNSAAAELNFEIAASLRDTIRHIEAAIRHRPRILEGPGPVDSQTALCELASFLKLPSPPSRIEAYDISNLSGTCAVGSMVTFLDGRPEKAAYRRFRIRTTATRDDPGMMAEVVTRRFARLTVEQTRAPNLLLVDGGIAQASAARSSLQKLGFTDLPVVGLAKRLEELYLAPFSRPLRLPSHSGALRLLQHIRDEAHRFSLTYHRRLRSKRIRESLLDEVSGIGERKKHALLRRFGSIKQIASASCAEIAKTPGIGPKLASAIKLALPVQPVRASRGPRPADLTEPGALRRTPPRNRP